MHYLSRLRLVPPPGPAQVLESSGAGGWLSNGGREQRPAESQLRNKKATLPAAADAEKCAERREMKKLR